MNSQTASAAALSNTPATGVTMPTDNAERFYRHRWRNARPSGTKESSSDDRAEAVPRTVSDREQTDANEQVAPLQSFVEKKPLQSAGIALLAGFVLSRLLR